MDIMDIYDTLFAAISLFRNDKQEY